MIVYDPVGLNPYGRELSDLLAEASLDVKYVGERNAGWMPARVVGREWLILASSRDSDGLFRHWLLRVLSPLLVVWIALLRRDKVIVAWTRGAWDALVVTICARGIRSLVVIDHNPRAIRPRGGLAGRTGEWLRRSADAVVVHSAALVTAGSPNGSSSTAKIIPLVPYDRWCERFCSGPAKLDEPVIGFIGTMRADKGVNEFIEVVRRTKWRPMTASFVGAGGLSNDQADSLRAAGVAVIHPGATPLTNEEFAERLSGVDLVVAPYLNATQSSSVLLALGCGIGVIAYDSGAISDLLVDASLRAVGDAQGVADLVDAYLEHPWDTARRSLKLIRTEALAGWSELLEAETGPNCHDE